MKRKKRKEKAFKERLSQYAKRDLFFYMENAKIHCEYCNKKAKVHAHSKQKNLLRYACWNKECKLYGVEQTITNCHREVPL